MTPKLLRAVVLDSVGFDGLQCLLDLLDLRGRHRAESPICNEFLFSTPGTACRGRLALSSRFGSR